MRAAIITISTSKSAGEGEDDERERLAGLAERLGAEIAGRDLIPDDRELIEERFRHWADVERCELVLSTGGTGFAPTDVTPEATLAVIEREAPGIAEAMRDASREHTRHWMLSRGVAGIRGSSLIVNFPGSPESIDQAGEAIADGAATRGRADRRPTISSLAGRPPAGLPCAGHGAGPPPDRRRDPHDGPVEFTNSRSRTSPQAHAATGPGSSLGTRMPSWEREFGCYRSSSSRS